MKNKSPSLILFDALFKLKTTFPVFSLIKKTTAQWTAPKKCITFWGRSNFARVFIINHTIQSCGSKGYTNSSKSDETKYRKILKEWLKDEIQFIKEIKPIIEKNPFVAFSNVIPLLNDLMKASYKLQENKIFWNADEDTRTRQILDLLPQKYEAKDQSRYGESGTGIKQGSIDGVVKDESGTEYFLEAFNLEYIDTNNITSHINKLEQNYDSKGLYNKYVIVYCNLAENKFEDFTKSYQQFIDSEMKFLYSKNGDSKDIETKYTNNRILKTSHLREGKEVFLYHILLKFPKKDK